MKGATKPVAPAINLHIGSLALPGYSLRDGTRLAEALKRELGRLLAAQPLPAQGFQADRLQIARFRRHTGERPELTGRRLARLIAQQLGD